MTADLETLYVTHPSSRELLRRTWELVIVDGVDRGRRAKVDRSPALLGAAPAAVLVLNDDTVSRYHVELEVLAHGLRIRDLESTNGTFVGNRRIREAFVDDTQAFRLGHTTVRLVAHDTSDEPELALSAGTSLDTLSSALAKDPKMRRAFEVIRRVGPTSAPVLLVGEPGSGKATCARLVHTVSARRGATMSAVELSADPAQSAGLLFGVLRGKVSAPGALERAAGGTLFLQRVELLTPELQTHLAVVLERGEIVRGDKAVKIDVRIVAASERAPDPSGFSARLLRRLGAVTLLLPPLRERPADLVPLARSFLERRARPQSIRGPSDGAQGSVGPVLASALAAESWPGNIDELREAMIDLGKHWNVDLTAVRPHEKLRVAHAVDALREVEGNVSELARKLGARQLDLFRFLSRFKVDLESMESK